MRYLLLILACSVMGFAAELEPALGYREAEAAHRAEVAALNNAWEARQKAYMTLILPLFTTVPVPALSPDPKQSEYKARDAANARNRIVERLTTQGVVENTLPWLLSEVGQSPQAMPKLPAFGPAMQSTIKSETDERPKEKKKITAVLADGTKVE